MIEDFSAYFDSGVWVGGAQICVPLFFDQQIISWITDRDRCILYDELISLIGCCEAYADIGMVKENLLPLLSSLSMYN